MIKFGVIFGVILSLAVATGAEAQMQTKVFSVDARENSWAKAGADARVDTGVRLSKGDSFTVFVQDPETTWMLCGEEKNCKATVDGKLVGNRDPGKTDWGDYDGKVQGKTQNVYLTATKGSLVGRVGDGPLFLVGTESKPRTAQNEGTLQLFMWDHNWENNSGTVPVTVVTSGCPQS